MNDFDLESKLKSVPVPERTDEYWYDFPSRVRVQLRRERDQSVPVRAWRPQLAWAGGLALGVALGGVWCPCARACAAAPRARPIRAGPRLASAARVGGRIGAGRGAGVCLRPILPAPNPAARHRATTDRHRD